MEKLAVEKEMFDISGLRLVKYSSNFNNNMSDNHRRLIAISRESTKIYEITKVRHVHSTSKEANMFSSIFSKLKSFSSTPKTRAIKSNFKFKIQPINQLHKPLSNADTKYILDNIDNIYKRTERQITSDTSMTDQQKQNVLKSMYVQPNAFQMRIFLTNDNKKLIIIGTVPGINACYNIFDFDNNKWLLPLDNHFDIFDIKSIYHSQTRPCYSYAHSELFINDSLLIISFENMIYFYDLSNLLKPLLMQEYKIESKKVKENTNNQAYWYHNMCLLSYTGKYKKLKNEYYISFLIIGGMHVSFPNSLIQIDLQLSEQHTKLQETENKNKKMKNSENKPSNYNSNGNCECSYDCGYKIVSIIEKSLLNENEKLDLTKTVHDIGNLNSFSCQVVKNMKGENIIIMIGGKKSGWVNPPDGFDHSVFFFNLNQKSIVEKENVLDKRYNRPYSMVKNNKLFVCQDCNFYQIDLKNLIDDYQGYGYSLSWEIERLIWIGYFKNQIDTTDKNKCQTEKDKCLLPTLPKDIIFHVLQFCMIN